MAEMMCGTCWYRCVQIRRGIRWECGRRSPVKDIATNELTLPHKTERVCPGYETGPQMTYLSMSISVTFSYWKSEL